MYLLWGTMKCYQTYLYTISLQQQRADESKTEKWKGGSWLLFEWQNDWLQIVISKIMLQLQQVIDTAKCSVRITLLPAKTPHFRMTNYFLPSRDKGEYWPQSTNQIGASLVLLPYITRLCCILYLCLCSSRSCAFCTWRAPIPWWNKWWPWKGPVGWCGTEATKTSGWSSSPLEGLRGGNGDKSNQGS